MAFARGRAASAARQTIQAVRRLCSANARWDLEVRPRDPAGVQGERIAAGYLAAAGYLIVAQNERNVGGELDLVAVESVRRRPWSRPRRTVVFVEVKSWTRPDPSGSPADAVDQAKQLAVTRAALVYLRSKRLLESPVRFDVIAVILEGKGGRPEVRHFKAAFESPRQWEMF